MLDYIPIPFAYLHNKDLNVFDSLILSYINLKKNEEFVFSETDSDIFKQLNVNRASLPNTLNKLYKLGYIDIHNENNQRIITYTYDAPHSLSQSGYIYIMADETHSYLKIGYSKNPKFRESTLQGEKPTIHLIAKFKGTMSQEQTCHRILAKYRVRGEWFNVTQQQAEQVIKQVIGIK